MKNNKRAFTLLEIVISSIILAITSVGLTGICISGKKYIAHARARMAGGELGELFLNPLQSYVSQGERNILAFDGWDDVNNALRVTGGILRYCDSNITHTQQPFCPPQADRTLAGIEYSAKYEIENHPDTDKIRKVVTTINWIEP